MNSNSAWFDLNAFCTAFANETCLNKTSYKENTRNRIDCFRTCTQGAFKSSDTFFCIRNVIDLAEPLASAILPVKGIFQNERCLSLLPCCSRSVKHPADEEARPELASKLKQPTPVAPHRSSSFYIFSTWASHRTCSQAAAMQPIKTKMSFLIRLPWPSTEFLLEKIPSRLL